MKKQQKQCYLMKESKLALNRPLYDSTKGTSNVFDVGK